MNTEKKNEKWWKRHGKGSVQADFCICLLHPPLFRLVLIQTSQSNIFLKKILFGTSLFLDILFPLIPVLKPTFLLLQAKSQRHFGPELK